MFRPSWGGLCAVAAALLIPAGALAQPAHIYGIHDDGPMPNDWRNQCPGATTWITATRAIGTNPSDMSGDTFSPPTGSFIICRLNVGYFPTGTIPVVSQYGDFATRCANYVNASAGCDTWIIGNETNLAAEWPNSGGTLVSVSPEDYANCFKQCYNAIKAVKPNDKVLVQALAPWAGPYGAGNLGGYTHAGQPDNWADYQYKMLVAITTGPGAVTPDGLAMHINTRGWNPATVFNQGPYIEANNLTLDFGWGVHKDWVQFGTPRNLWNLPMYATESNGLFYWQGGGPESAGDPAYVAGWLQKIYEETDKYNAQAKAFGMPVYRCVNMYRWCNCDGWSIDALPGAQRAQVLSDLAAAAVPNYQWAGGPDNSVTLTVPGGTKIATVASVTASSFDTGFEPSRAFDGSVGTWWGSLNTGASSPHWIAVDLGSDKSLTGHIVRHITTSGSPTHTANRNTVGFYVEASTTGLAGPWTLHTMVRNNTPGTNGAAVTNLKYTSPVTARYLRIYVNDAAVDTVNARGRITEWEIYEADPPTPYNTVYVDGTLPLSADTDGDDEFATIQAAIDSFRTGGPNHGFAGANVIEIRNTTAYDQAFSLTDAGGALEALRILGQGSPGPVIRVREGQDAENLALTAPERDGVRVNTAADVTFENLRFVPSGAAPFADDMFHLARPVGGTTLVEFKECVLTSANASGQPVVSTRAQALTSNLASVATAPGDDFIHIEGAASQAVALALEGSIISHGAQVSGRDGIVDAGTAAGAGAPNIRLTRTVVSYLGRYGINFVGTGHASNADEYRYVFEGTASEPTFFKNTLSHAIIDSGVSGRGHIYASNMRFCSNTRAFSLAARLHLKNLQDSILANQLNACVVLAAPFTSPATVTNCKFHNVAYPFVLSLATNIPQTITVRNTIFSDAAPNDDVLIISFSSGTGTWTVDIDISAIVTDGGAPYRISGIGTTGFELLGGFIVTADPDYVNATDCTAADFLVPSSPSYLSRVEDALLY